MLACACFIDGLLDMIDTLSGSLHFLRSNARAALLACMPAALVLLSSCGGAADPENSVIPQSISFPAVATLTFNAPPQALAAAASSGLPVSYSSSTPAVCTVTGNTLIINAAGTCTVAANQAGDVTYAAAAPVTQNINVLRAAQSISFVAPGNQALGGAPVTLVGSATSGLSLTFSSSTPLICAVSGNTLTLVAGGRCQIAAQQAGNGNYLAAADVAASFDVSVVLQSQTISFPALGNQTLGGAAVPLAATATSNLPVSFMSLTPAVCVVGGTNLTLLTAGTCTVAASQPGNGVFAAAATVVNTLAVATAAQTITFATPAAQTLGTPAAALVASASSGLPVSFASSTAAVCTVSGSTLTLVAAGNCTITASQPGNGSFSAAAPVARTFAVQAGAQTISFASPGNQTLGTAPPALAATATSGLPVLLVSTTPSVCSVSGTTLTLIAVGTCSVEARQAGNASFAAATPVVRAFTVASAAPVAQTISFPQPASQTLGTGPVALVATASSGLPVSFASTTPSTCSVSGSTLTLVAVGSCIVDASQAGNASFNAAITVSRVITISAPAPAAQTISFASPGNQTLGAGPVALVATASSGLPVSLVSNTTNVCTVSGSTLGLVAAGTCSVTATQGGNASFQAAPSVTVSFNISAAPLSSQTISFPSPGTQTFGISPVTLVATATSGLPVSFTTSTPGVCTVSSNSLTLLAVGNCVVTANQGGNGSFAGAAAVSNSFTVLPGAQSISFASPGTQALLTVPPALSATASSGLQVVFSTTTPGVCTVSGITLSLVSAGLCTINANQGGGGNFGPAPTVSQSFTVNRAAQTIGFTSPGDQTLRTATPAVSATASSGLAVSIASTTSTVCTVSGSTLTLASAGTCTLQAAQAGDATYAPATLSVSFAVLKYELFANGGFETVGTTTPALAWRQAASGYSLSTDARTGQFSVRLASPAISAAIALQNSVDDGMRQQLEVGSAPVLTFWAKGFAGTTANLTYSLRYLDGVGNILATTGNQVFGAAINTTTWSLITAAPLTVPAGAVAAFIEFSQAMGAIDPGLGLLGGTVLIDDLSLK